MKLELTDEEADLLWSLLTESADGERRDARLFWTEELRETREMLEQRANAYVEIANRISAEQAKEKKPS